MSWVPHPECEGFTEVAVSDRGEWPATMDLIERWVLGVWPHYGSSYPVADASTEELHWLMMPGMGDLIHCWFRDPRAAMLFRLTWS